MMTYPTLSAVISQSYFVDRSLRATQKDPTEKSLLEALSTKAQQRWTSDRLEQFLEERLKEGQELGMVLRELRREVLLNLIARNATGVCGYDEVVCVMSDFAELAISKTIAYHARELALKYGIPTGYESQKAQDLLVVGMGKLGGKELNVSSDVDLVFLYDEIGECHAWEKLPVLKKVLTNQEFFERLARRVIPALNDIEGAGFVFRVDMRLRPNGDAGPIVCSSDMLEEYLYTQGREWERFAWLKARILKTPVFTLDEDFLRQSHNLSTLIRPFVFRKYLDFNAIASLREVHEVLRAETNRKELERQGQSTNVKLGRGGIREIEFIVQTLQLIRGGRQPQLRGKSTLDMLDVLAISGALKTEDAQRLQKEYVFLRNVEHAIQYVDDQQTHSLPKSGETLDRISTLLGTTPNELWIEVEKTQAFVSKVFEGIFQVEKNRSENTEGWPMGWETGTKTALDAVSKKLQSLGYEENVEEITQRIALLVSSRAALTRSENSRQVMAKLIEYVVEHVPQWIAQERVQILKSDTLLLRYLMLLETIAGRSTYVSLLGQYPRIADRLGRVLLVSRWSAQYISKHPIILDELMDDRTERLDNETPVNWQEWTDQLERELQEVLGDTEREMNLLRDHYHAAVFRLMISDLDGRLSVERLADHLSALVDAILRIVMKLAWHTLKQPTQSIPQMVIVAYGKLGGKELGYESDLDLVFIFDGDVQEGTLYSRFARRILSWLTVQTSSGNLFEVDLRLRPNGENGLLVSPYAYFEKYYLNEDGHGAWFWELQALTRARVCVGNEVLTQKIENLREHILLLARSNDVVRKEVCSMREKMMESYSNKSELFDIKHDRGGMIDFEFMVQYIVLSYAKEYRALAQNLGNIKLMQMAADLDLVDRVLAKESIVAYRQYRHWQHEMRLNWGEASGQTISQKVAQQYRESIIKLWNSLFQLT